VEGGQHGFCIGLAGETQINEYTFLSGEALRTSSMIRALA